MKSRYYDKFNHDEDARDYDEDVLNEDNPVRRGYAELLKWAADLVNNFDPDKLIELGSGSGNLTLMISEDIAVDTVDISGEMIKLAQGKLAERNNVRFIQDDLLGFFETGATADAVVSTYAIHHLIESEKELLCRKIYGCLMPGGIAVIGDLGFESAAVKKTYYDELEKSGRGALIEDIEDEFYWDIESAVRMMTDIGFSVEVKRFSQLSWGFDLVKGYDKQ